MFDSVSSLNISEEKASSAMHLPADGVRGDDALKSKFGDTYCSICIHLYSFGSAGEWSHSVMEPLPCTKLLLSIFEESLSRT